jgi:hypothetical protein
MTKTIGSLLLDRLHHLGLNHIFGIPGDYILTLYKLIEESPIQHIGTTREDCRICGRCVCAHTGNWWNLCDLLCGWTKYRQCRRLCLC